MVAVTIIAPAPFFDVCFVKKGAHVLGGGAKVRASASIMTGSAEAGESLRVTVRIARIGILYNNLAVPVIGNVMTDAAALANLGHCCAHVVVLRGSGAGLLVAITTSDVAIYPRRRIIEVGVVAYHRIVTTHPAL